MVELVKQRHLQNVIAATPDDEKGDRPAATSGTTRPTSASGRNESRILTRCKSSLAASSESSGRGRSGQVAAGAKKRRAASFGVWCSFAPTRVRPESSVWPQDRTSSATRPSSQTHRLSERAPLPPHRIIDLRTSSPLGASAGPVLDSHRPAQLIRAYTREGTPLDFQAPAVRTASSSELSEYLGGPYSTSTISVSTSPYFGTNWEVDWAVASVGALRGR